MKKSFSMIRMSFFAIGTALTMGLLFTACLKSDDDNPDVPVAGVMAFNLAPDVSAMSVTLSGNTLTATPLAFNSFTGNYLAAYPGSRAVEAFNYNTGASLSTRTYNFEADKYYSVFVVGTDGAYQQVIVNDSLDDQSPATQAYIRYINAIPDSSQPTVTITTGGSNVVNENAGFATVSDFTAVTPGSVDINVTNGGMIDASRTITLEQGKIYTLLLTGMPGATGDQAVQIKYITNGTVDTNAGKAAAVAGRKAQ